MRQRIAQTCVEVRRDPASVILTAVSKTQPSEALEAALATGQRVFGENRVQEAQGTGPSAAPPCRTLNCA